MHAVGPARRFVAALLLLLAIPAPALALEVRVDPRVEFAAAMCRLAGFEEYQGPGIAAYDAAVDAHFAPFRDHPSIRALRGLRESAGLSYNMPVELALATGDGDWTLRLPTGDPAAGLDSRWTPEAAQAFLAAAAALWRDADAPGFFRAQAPLHREAEAVLTEALRPRLDEDWFARQYGRDDGRRLVVVAGLLNGPNSYGPGFVLPDGRREAYAVLATPAMPAGAPLAYPADQVASLLVHELHHPYVNPWVEANAARLERGAGALFAAVAERMRAAAYGRWQYMLNESLVRAQVLRYYRSRGDAGAYEANLRDDRARGFAWVDALADALDATGEDGFGPASEAAVFAFFEAWGADPVGRIAAEDARQAERLAARRALGARVVEASPALDGGRAAPGEGELRLRFDRPMAGGIALMGEPPDVTGRPRWEDDGRVLVVPVRFAAGARHMLRLNDEATPGEGFVGRDGAWLVPLEWSFEVGGAPAD